MTQSESYSAPQIALHWVMAALIGTNYIVSEGMGEALDARLETANVLPVGLTPTVHVYVGVAVLALVVVRLVLRLVKGAPAAHETTPALMHLAATVTHVTLYALLFAVPAFGALAWFAGIDAFGGLAWFAGIDAFGGLHVLAMNAMMILVGLHAAAAIFHHYVLKDGLLRRMMRPS